MLEADVKQRRQYARVAMELPLSFSWGTKQSRQKAEGVSHNLSAGGIFFRTQARPPVGAPIRLHTLLPPILQGATPLVMKVEGRIVRVEPAARPEEWNAVAAVSLRHVLQEWRAIHEESKAGHERPNPRIS